GRSRSGAPPPVMMSCSCGGLSCSGSVTLSADLAHRARGLAEARLRDVVLELLAPHGVANRLHQPLVAGILTKQPTQVGLVHAEQACPELALGGQPDAVAIRAERLRDGVDEADLSPAVHEAPHLRGRVGLPRNRLEG